MKIKAIVFAIILALTFVVEVRANVTQRKGQSSRPRPNRTVKTKPTSVPQEETIAAEKQIEYEVAALSKLAEADKQQIKASIEGLVTEITKAKLGDRLTKATRDLEIDTGRSPFASLQKRLDESLTLLPPKGITAKALRLSWDALNDYLILELGAENNVVTNNSLNIIRKYDLKGNSLYVMSLEVLDVALYNAGVAFQLLKDATRNQ